ncbi:activating signal cointegrator 1 [Anoplophora glabripennis]|uniref:activating signal cointegrator 1 n=1 Tax=Anoplophora glabripennis TaxID=217634 RepID=UPI000874E44C|nr:activating signal cointegrator 1 [Anoplophora glabripennis]
MTKQEPLVEYLKVIIGNDVSSDIVSYIKSIKHEEDYEEFMENILDKNNSAHMRSYEGIKNIILGYKNNEKNSNNAPQKTDSRFDSQSRSTQHQKKGKTKFRDINTYQAKKKEKDGRSPCDCLGQEHEFMNNCLVCGKIHCMEEGPGPCLFCGNPVTVRGEESFNNGGKTKSIMKPRENKVFDDDNDYFKINSKKNKEKESKKKMVVALDFAARRVIESSQEDAKIRERLLQESVEHLKKVEKVYKNIQKHSEQVNKEKRNKNVNDDLVNLLIQMRYKKPVGVEDLGQEDGIMPIIDYGTRVFDEDLMATVDHGLCLSMHQPYASLLVAGVKMHEGRTWPTTHRGRLWIAAAAKAPDEDEVDALESFYREYYQDPTLSFPKEFPTSCLLGCVFVEDCMEQEAYRKKYPNGESNSPFVLICSNPIILPIFYPIIGKHKIYPLDKELHKCAKMALQHAKYIS